MLPLGFRNSQNFMKILRILVENLVKDHIFYSGVFTNIATTVLLCIEQSQLGRKNMATR